MIEELNLPTYVQPTHQSSFADWVHCPRLGFFKHRLCIHPRRPTVKRAPQLGTLTHQYVAYGTEPEEDIRIRQEAMDDIRPHLDALTRGDDPFGVSRQVLKDTEDNLLKARVMAEMFQERYPANPDLVTLTREQPISGFFQLMPREPVWLAGILDALDQLQTDGSYWVRDIKTTGMKPDLKLVGYQYAAQKRFYRLLAMVFLRQVQEAGPSAEATGFILNIIQTPAIVMSGEDRDYLEVEHVLKSGPRKGEVEKRRIYDGEPKFENYLERCRRWYQDQEGVQPGDSPIRSYMIPFTEPAIPLDFADHLIIASMWSKCRVPSRLAQAAHLFHRDPLADECCRYSSVCDYYPLCQRETATWPHIIREHYDQREPDLYIDEDRRLIDKSTIFSFEPKEPKGADHDDSHSDTPATDPAALPYGGRNPRSWAGNGAVIICSVGGDHRVSDDAAGEAPHVHPGTEVPGEIHVCGRSPADADPGQGDRGLGGPDEVQQGGENPPQGLQGAGVGAGATAP